MPSSNMRWLFSALAGCVLLATCMALESSSDRRPRPSTIRPSPSDIAASKATAPALSPTSSVQGKSFNRILQIWLENTDYDLAATNPDMKWLAANGITLTNFWALTHPSQPNYCAAAGGDTFGMDSNSFIIVPKNISTVVDLLDTKGISWGEYQEGMPHAGYQGHEYSSSSRNDYVRKHNPLIMFESVTSNTTRLSLIKNLTSFDSDLSGQSLPQWSFITPNMTNNGHDTSLDVAAKWSRNFIEPLLSNAYFMKDTLLMLTFDENHHYALPNRIFTLLLGGAVPAELNGTSDDTFYTHYSTISTVESNWDLPSLGRWDCGANILTLVANKTGYVNWSVNTTNLYFNTSYPGPLSDKSYINKWPLPETRAECSAGSGVLEAVAESWGRSAGGKNYTKPYPYDEESKNNGGGIASRPSSSGVSEAPTTTSRIATRPTGAGSVNGVPWGWKVILSVELYLLAGGL